MSKQEIIQQIIAIYQKAAADEASLKESLADMSEAELEQLLLTMQKIIEG